MPDISMCKNKTCVLRDNCYRSTAIPNPIMQMYNTFQPYKDREGNWECDFYKDNINI